VQISLSSISAGAMTAAVTLGSAMQSIGAGAVAAAQSLPAVAAGGAQALAQGASVATTVLPQSVPAAVDAGARGASMLSQNLTLVEKPVAAAASGISRSSLLLRTANFLRTALPIVTIGASALSGAHIVSTQGGGALLTTKQGRGALLGAVGGVCLLIPTPVTQLAAAASLGAVAANEFGAFNRFDAHALPSV
jgi:hypothetical protein